MSRGLICNNCGRCERETAAINWLKTTYTGVEGRTWDSPNYAGDFCCPECLKEYIEKIGGEKLAATESKQ